jgi:hypothetical protein
VAVELELELGEQRSLCNSDRFRATGELGNKIGNRHMEEFTELTLFKKFVFKDGMFVFKPV